MSFETEVIPLFIGGVTVVSVFLKPGLTSIILVIGLFSGMSGSCLRGMSSVWPWAFSS